MEMVSFYLKKFLICVVVIGSGLLMNLMNVRFLALKPDIVFASPGARPKKESRVSAEAGRAAGLPSVCDCHRHRDRKRQTQSGLHGHTLQQAPGAHQTRKPGVES